MTTSPPSSRRTQFTRLLPKVELHAHLAGSIRRSTLLSLAASHHIDPTHAFILTRWPRTLSEAFSVFRIIHSCVATLPAVERLAYEVAQDLDSDGVVYAEIRTTPRNLDSGGFDAYVRAVLSGLHRAAADGAGVVVRVLLSFDRARHTAAQAREIVALALSHPQVVGIDLSGDPTRGNFATFLPALQHARERGLKITLHAGEVPSTDAEMRSMLDFNPDRFGHCCFVNPENLARLKAQRTPIELCPTSNVLSNSVASLSEHQFGVHYTGDGDGAVCCIATDDSGVFGSPLSNEYGLVMDAFGLGERETFELARRTLQAAFLRRTGEMAGLGRDGDDKVWQSIQAKFDAFEKSWDWE